MNDTPDRQDRRARLAQWIAHRRVVVEVVESARILIKVARRSPGGWILEHTQGTVTAPNDTALAAAPRCGPALAAAIRRHFPLETSLAQMQRDTSQNDKRRP